MILDTVGGLFQTLRGPVWDTARAFAASAAQRAPGRYELDNGVFAMVQDGVTLPSADGFFEAHRSYLDLQILVSGQELLFWADVAGLSQTVPYDAQKDIAFYEGTGAEIALQPGMCYVMYPHDGHKPCRHREAPCAYRKLVIKIPQESVQEPV